MKLLWTKSNNLGSRLIQWGTKGDCSHFAVVFDEKPGGYGLIFHSSLTGVGLDWLGSFKAVHQIVHCMAPVTPPDEEVIYQSLVSRFSHKPYDNLAYAYFALKVLQLKTFGTPLPERNQWGNKNSFLCTEIAQCLKDSNVMGLPDLTDYGMISPSGLYGIMKSQSPLWQDSLVP